jgi:hypothetical protein
MSRNVLFVLAALSPLFCTIHAQEAAAPTPAAKAQVQPWKLDINTNLTMTLNTYSKNWIGGEVKSFTWAGNATASAEKQFSPKLNNKNVLKLAFGQTKAEDKGTKSGWAAPQKSTDLIDFETVLKFTLGGFVDPFISGHAVSQFVDGSDAAALHYGNPVTITEALGAQRAIVKNDLVGWDARLGAGARQLVDRYKLDATTGTRESDVTNDGGLEFVTNFKAVNKEKWLSFETKFSLFEALFNSKSKDLTGDAATDWRYPDINWENQLTISVAKYIMIGGYLQLLYDRDLHKNARFKETLSVGLTYAFTSAK